MGAGAGVGMGGAAAAGLVAGKENDGGVVEGGRQISEAVKQQRIVIAEKDVAAMELRVSHRDEQKKGWFSLLIGKLVQQGICNCRHFVCVAEFCFFGKNRMPGM